MKRLKTAVFLLFTLGCIALGAALPYLASCRQDAQRNGVLKKEELSAVDLTLRQKGDVGPAFRLLEKEYTENIWEGETALDAGEASRAAREVMESLDRHGLLPEGDLEALSASEENVEPHLLVAEDGGSALLWMCTWGALPGTFITVDDSTGKAVRMMVGYAPDGGVEEERRFWMEKWFAFLQEYYGPEAGIDYAPLLEIEMEAVFFNYPKDP